jgi:PQQ-like domain
MADGRDVRSQPARSVSATPKRDDSAHAHTVALPMLIAAAVWMLALGMVPSRTAAATGPSPAPTSGATGAGMDWSMWGHNVQRTGSTPGETILGPSTVAGLHHLWTFPFADKSDNAPVLASGVDGPDGARDLLYAGDRSGVLYAVDAATGTQVWSRDLGTNLTACFGRLGITDTGVIDRSRNLLFVAGGDGQLYALDLASGATAPGWPLPITTYPNEYIWSAVAMFQESLYVAVAGGCDRGGTYYGRVVRVDPATVTQTATFYVTGGPDTGVSGGGIWGWGGVSIDPADGNLYVSTGNGYPTNPYEHFLYADDVVRLRPDLSVVSSDYPGIVGSDKDFGSTPVLFQARRVCGPQLIAENKDGEIFLYDRDNLSAGPVDRIAVSGGGLVGVAAFDPVSRRIFVGNPADSADGTYRHGLLAFRVLPDCMLRLAWQKTVGIGGLSASPVVANGIVYFGDGSGHRLLAYDTATRKKLWDSRTTFDSSAQTEPIVVNGRVYETTGSAMYAFGL